MHTGQAFGATTRTKLIWQLNREKALPFIIFIRYLVGLFVNSFFTSEIVKSQKSLPSRFRFRLASLNYSCPIFSAITSADTATLLAAFLRAVRISLYILNNEPPVGWCTQLSAVHSGKCNIAL